MAGLSRRSTAASDDRPTQILAALTAGLDDRHAILLTDLNWQVENGLSYFGKEIAPDVAYERMPAVILYAPALVADNAAIDRDVALTERARNELAGAYGPLIRIRPRSACRRSDARATRLAISPTEAATSSAF